MVMVARLSIITLLLAYLPLAPAIAQDHYAFTKPPPATTHQDLADDPVYELGSTIKVKWTASDPSKIVSLVVFQKGERNDFDYVFSKLAFRPTDLFVFGLLASTDGQSPQRLSVVQFPGIGSSKRTKTSRRTRSFSLNFSTLRVRARLHRVIISTSRNPITRTRLQ